MTMILPFAIVYFIYVFARDLIKFEGTWGPAQWIMLVLLVIFVALLYPTGKNALEESKKQKEKSKEEAAEQQKQLEASRRAKYYEDFGDGPGYDELHPAPDDAPEADGADSDNAAAGSGAASADPEMPDASAEGSESGADAAQDAPAAPESPADRKD